jgi:hypothetical protein
MSELERYLVEGCTLRYVQKEILVCPDDFVDAGRSDTWEERSVFLIGNLTLFDEEGDL